MAGLLQGALAGQSLKDLHIENEQEIWRLARCHGVLPLLYETGREPEEAARAQVLQFYRLLFATKFYTRLLEREGIPCVVLKGCGAAYYYPREELRKSGDVDILVTDTGKWQEARAVLEKNGAVLEAGQASYHVSYRIPGGILLELHSSFTEELDDSRANRLLEELLENLSEHIRHAELAGVSFPVLRRPYQAISLLLHMLHHFRTGGFGMKLLCDWTALWNQEAREEDTKEYQEWVSRFGLEGFSGLVTGACRSFLGLKSERGPEGSGDEGLLELFMKDIWESGEFGSHMPERMAVLRGVGIGAYLRELHHQMLLGFPKKKKQIWLWPLLWLITLFRFVSNNKRIRRVSTWSVLKKAAQRSRYMKAVGLFEVRKERKSQKPSEK